MTESTRSLLAHLSSGVAALVLGGVCGYRILRRQYINEKVAELFNPPQPAAGNEALHRELRQIRGAVNDTHKLIRAVSKGLEIPPRQVTQNTWPSRIEPAVP